MDTVLRDRPAMTLVMLGHAGHGKTTLLAAITRVLSARLGYSAAPRSVESLLPRGYDPSTSHANPSSSHAALAHYDTPRRRYAHFDVPGRRRLLRLASRTLSLRDAGLLVVSAVDASAQQTREHVLHARELGLKRLVVFINRCDEVDSPEWLDEVERDVRRALDDCGAPGDDVPVLRGAARPAYLGDARWTPSIHALVDALDHELADEPRDVDGPLAFVVDEVWPVGVKGGRDPVALGKVLRGRLAVGQRMWLHGFGLDREVTALEVQHFRRSVVDAVAGEVVGVRLGGGGDARAWLRRGVVLTTAKVTARPRLEATLRMLTGDEGGHRKAVPSPWKVFLHLGAAGVPAKVERVDGEVTLAPGDRARVIVTPDAPVWVEPGMVMVLRDGIDGAARQGPRNGDPTKQGATVPHRWGGTAAVGSVTDVSPAPRPEDAAREPAAAVRAR